MKNTKAIHQEILTTAKNAIADAGGVEAIDGLPLIERGYELRKLYVIVSRDADCHIDTAKRNVAKALRLARGEIVKARWGGNRGGGRPRKEINQLP